MGPVTNSIPPKTEQGMSPPRVLLVQINSEVESSLHVTLERHGFRVVTKATIKEALACLTELNFAALICDLHLPAAGDGFTLLNAMRHLHPDAVSIIMSDYAPLRESLAELLPQADEILVTPVDAGDIVNLLKNRLSNPTHRTVKFRESVARILERHASGTIDEWLKRVNQSEALSAVQLSDV